MAQAASGRGDRFAFLDWLRGVAAWLVVCFHFVIHVLHDYPRRPIPAGSFADHFILGDFDLGKFSVAVFFMVSGFLIPSTLRSRSATLRAYAIHRFFRLYPAYWLSLLVVAIVYGWLGTPPSMRQALINATMLQGFVGIDDVIGVYWTLQIELIFYVVCGALFWVGRNEPGEAKAILFLGIGLLVATARSLTGMSLPLAIPMALALMFLGDLLRAEAEGQAHGGRPLRLSVIVLVGLGPICLLGYGEEGLRYWLSYATAVGAFLVAFAFRGGISRSTYGGGLRTFLADTSYSVYLLHPPIGLTLGMLVLARTASPWAAGIATFGSTALVATFAFYLIERPGIRLGKAISSPTR